MLKRHGKSIDDSTTEFYVISGEGDSITIPETNLIISRTALHNCLADMSFDRGSRSRVTRVAIKSNPVFDNIEFTSIKVMGVISSFNFTPSLEQSLASQIIADLGCKLKSSKVVKSLNKTPYKDSSLDLSIDVNSSLLSNDVTTLASPLPSPSSTLQKAIKSENSAILSSPSLPSNSEIKSRSTSKSQREAKAKLKTNASTSAKNTDILNNSNASNSLNHDSEEQPSTDRMNVRSESSFVSPAEGGSTLPPTEELSSAHLSLSSLTGCKNVFPAAVLEPLQSAIISDKLVKKLELAKITNTEPDEMFSVCSAEIVEDTESNGESSTSKVDNVTASPVVSPKDLILNKYTPKYAPGDNSSIVASEEFHTPRSSHPTVTRYGRRIIKPRKLCE